MPIKRKSKPKPIGRGRVTIMPINPKKPIGLKKAPSKRKPNPIKRRRKIKK